MAELEIGSSADIVFMGITECPRAVPSVYMLWRLTLLWSPQQIRLTSISIAKDAKPILIILRLFPSQFAASETKHPNLPMSVDARIQPKQRISLRPMIIPRTGQ